MRAARTYPRASAIDIPSLAAVTPAQFLNAIKAKADEIVVDRPEKP